MKKNEKKLSFAQQMNAVVLVNQATKMDEDMPDYVRIRVSLKLGFWAKFVSIFFKVRDYKKYLLTGFNCTLYRYIAANTPTVKDIVYHLMNTEKLSFFESRALTLQYVGTLMQRALVVAEVPPEENDDPEDDGNPPDR